MIKLRYALPAVMVIMTQAAFSDPILASYYATIDRQDFYNSSGAPLKDVGSVIQQDRANFHRFGVRHSGDESDPYFGDRAMRARIPDLVRAGGVDHYLRQLLGRGWQGYSQTWLIQICGTPGRITHLRIAPADGDGYPGC
ncbi:hypothetical protein [Neptunicoccus cionae]|uniref:Uncharacterized protein n=1 Tax=Neptunicoccus cionae TaxID=2035344 RepID=A0A916VM34_9RHOB|nr:hypothetical protein [Amylibacter cionae]GGA05060.1 hypothetical protein GCM10011498_00570 [Amylibacter cionae]